MQPISFCANADINFVRSVNPAGAKSIVFRGLSSSVYPISLAIPVAAFIHGEIKKNKAEKRNAYDELGSVAVAAVVTEGLKIAINRERPYEKYSGVYPYEYEKGKSFPSAHAAISFATATTLSLEYKKWYVVVPAYAWAAGCSFSRIYLGEHYPSDVLAGAAVGSRQCHYYSLAHEKNLQVMFGYKRADAEETDIVRSIAFETWPITYEAILGKDQVNYMLETLYSHEALRSQFAKGDLFYFIYSHEDVAGFVSFGKESETAWKLHKIYILPKQQGIGAGKALLDFVIRKVVSLGGAQLLLNVNRFNKARFFYEKNGFYITKEIDIDIGNGFFMNDYIMQLDLDTD